MLWIKLGSWHDVKPAFPAQKFRRPSGSLLAESCQLLEYTARSNNLGGVTNDSMDGSLTVGGQSEEWSLYYLRERRYTEQGNTGPQIEQWRSDHCGARPCDLAAALGLNYVQKQCRGVRQ